MSLQVNCLPPTQYTAQSHFSWNAFVMPGCESRRVSMLYDKLSFRSLMFDLDAIIVSTSFEGEANGVCHPENKADQAA